MSQPSESIPSTTTSSAGRKPRISLAIATAFGLGYLPKAPGTFGSLVGVAAMALYWSRLLPIKSLDLFATKRLSPSQASAQKFCERRLVA